MGTSYGTSEIVEVEEGSDFEFSCVKPGKKFYVKDDINRLFESVRISAKNSGLPQVRGDNLQKKSMKRPMRVGPYQPSGIGISESISLKQALRGLSISQASEMAAMKRLSRPRISGVLEAGLVERQQRAEASENKPHIDMVQVSLTPEKYHSTLPKNKPKSLHTPQMENQTVKASTTSDVGKTSVTGVGQTRNLKLKLSSLSTRSKKKLSVVDEKVPSSVDVTQEKDQKPMSDLSSLPISKPDLKLIKPVFRNKNLIIEKSKPTSSTATSKFSQVDDLGPSTSDSGLKKAGPASSTNDDIEDSLGSMDSSASKFASIRDGRKVLKSRSTEKGELSQSSKSSIGEYSSSTSFSDESNLSHISRRPHMSKDLRWEAVHCVQKQNGPLNLRHFKLIRKIGGGDIGTVYLAELIGSNCFFALKVLDNEFLAIRNKATRAQTEREILQLLDHPFLPTLFAQFTNDKYSFFVIEYCPGGDLHVLRQKQPNKCFSEQAARFYVAEILLALEYLHMLGIVYRDLKPENILVREDGHIMLTDFDLSLRCAPNPTLVKPSSTPKNTDSSCIHPFCLQPSWHVPCFTPRLPSAALPDPLVQVTPLPELVVVPINARSNSFVGTHEYLAPEIVKGEGHGSPVDWWTFGVLLYELLYGRTPFKGTGNEETLANVVSQSLKFPDKPVVSSEARDLIRSLLRKQPENRLGSSKGAVEIKHHPFFEGLNWALIRCGTPPELPGISENWKFEKEFKGTGEHFVFDMF